MQWVEKHRPRQAADLILPLRTASVVNGLIKAQTSQLPNLLLFGAPGTGKTSTARILVAERKTDPLEINCAENGAMAAINEVKDSASTVPLFGSHKIVILDEADTLSKSAQSILRVIAEDPASICSLILICNDLDAIVQPLKSRCSHIAFDPTDDERPELSRRFLDRAAAILKVENVQFEIELLETIVTRHCPDWRRILNELQTNSGTGKLEWFDAEIPGPRDLDFLIGRIKANDLRRIRSWLNAHPGASTDLIKYLYENAEGLFEQREISVTV
jgi:Straboviridae sliding clamp loader